MHLADRLPAMKTRILLHCPAWVLLALLLAPTTVAAGPPTGFPTFDVIDYDAAVTPDLAARTVSGEVAIRLVSQVDGLAAVELAAPELRIESVTEAGRSLQHDLKEGRLRISLEPPAARDEARTLTVRYAGKPTRGMRFGTDQVFTVFNTAHWLLSQDDPADKAALTLRLTLPAGLDSVGPGKRIEEKVLADGRVQHVWRQDRPHSSYLFGFAAGRFQKASRQAGAVTLHFLSLDLAPAHLTRILGGTANMLEFFERKAGLPFPGESYTTVLMPDAPPQEVSSFTLLSEDYGRAVLASPREDHLIAHELAHQWWGNLITCQSWSEFWLNEGMATFLTAAYKEHFWGRDEYEHEMGLARLRYARALAEGKYRPLVYDGWSEPGEMGGPLTYSRGALVLHLLRRHLGERAFWEGLRTFTRANAGGDGTANTASLRAAMEQAAGQDLGWFFSQWVYATEPEDLVAGHWQEPGAVVVEIEQRQAEPWTVPLTVVVRTPKEEVRRTVRASGKRTQVRFETAEAPLSVRIDGDGELPRFVQHERPLAMLLEQLRSERDIPGRVDALIALEKLCADAARKEECRLAAPLLEEAGIADSSRLVRQLTARPLQALRAP
jgi:aminopeptidase N